MPLQVAAALAALVPLPARCAEIERDELAAIDAVLATGGTWVREVVMRDSRTGMLRRVAPRLPSWKGNLLDGHCILTLPDEDRHIDATIEQFPGISHLRLGPAVGRSGGYLTPDGRMVAVGSTASQMPPGAQLAIQRGPYMMLYTLADEPANQIITNSEHVRPHAELHRRAGINLASLTLAGLRSPNLNRLARAPPRRDRAPARHAARGTRPVAQAPLRRHDVVAS